MVDDPHPAEQVRGRALIEAAATDFRSLEMITYANLAKQFLRQQSSVDGRQGDGGLSCWRNRSAADRIATFCQRWQIVKLSLFGSVLREDFDSESDVDVLVQFDPGVVWNLLDLMTMRSELSTLLGRQVDLVEQAGLRNPSRRAAIIQSKQVVYAA